MKYLFLPLFCLISLYTYAQPGGATPGKCYANCYIGDQYFTETEQVMLQPPLKRVLPSKGRIGRYPNWRLRQSPG
ncbi:MAG: hypothetical protein R2792_19260 [Saprospiraceae bacterium]